MKKIILISLSLFLLFNFQFVLAQEKTKKVRPSKLSMAIYEKNFDAVKKYIEEGVDVNKPFMGSTPLADAISTKQDDILDYLLQVGADPNTNSGVPLLYFAVSEKNKYATAKLLKIGVDTQKTFMGTTAKDLASSYKTTEFNEIFIAYEKNKSAFNPDLYKNPYNYRNAESNEATLNANITFTLDKKDTNLISIQKQKPIDMKKYNQKIKNDYIEYQKNKKQLKEEQYILSTILDKLLRANKLQYQNWRIGMDIETEDVNAHAGSGNLIIINSSLYDSLYQNYDALAFIIAHELAHLILGHNQIALENSIRIQKLEYEANKAMAQAEKQNYIADLNNAVGNYGYALGSSISSLGYSISASALSSEINRVYEQERELEIIADQEAITLLTKADYNPEKAKEALDFLSNIPNVYTKRSTHPDIYTRQNNINENLFLNDNENLKNQGRKEILNSKVLEIKKSSDKKTVVLSKANGYSKYHYIPVSKEEKIIKKAYSYYLDNDYENAKGLFAKAYMLNPNNFIPALYLSYINEYQFKQNLEKKSLKEARKWIKRANRINSANKYVEKQNNDIKEIFVNLKNEKKDKKKG